MRNSKNTALAVVILVTLVMPLISIVETPRVSYAYAPVPFSAPASGVLQRPSGPISYQRTQYGAQGSGSYLVWGEKNTPVGQTPVMGSPLDDLRDTHDVAALNLTSNTSVNAATLAGNQTEPAIAGSLLIWQDNAHSCPTCEQDILGKNLSTGITFTVATGTSDQSHPAIAGTKVTWLDFSNNIEQLMVKDVNLQTPPTSFTSVLVTDGVTINRPAMSNKYVIWSEMHDPSPSQSTRSMTLKAYNLQTQTVTTIGQVLGGSVEYAVYDRWAVWNDTRSVHLTDLSIGSDTIVSTGGASPSISASSIRVTDGGTITIVWSAGSGNEANGFDIWGIRLVGGAGQPVLLVSEAGNQQGAVIVGDTLAWQHDGGPNTDRITTASLSGLFASPPPQPVQPPASTPTPEPGIPLPITNPLIKGIHAPNAIGWCDFGTNCSNSTSAVDALVDRGTNFRYFGAITVIQQDLDSFTTGAPSPWGPRVNDVMQSLVNIGIEPIVRSKPADRTIYQPNGQGTIVPRHDWDLIKDNLIQRPWMRRIQVENEPDGEWNAACEYCRFDGNSGGYAWSDRYDYRFYYAIDTWYGQMVSEKDVYVHYLCNPNELGCSRLRDHTIQLWSPALDPGLGYRPLSDGRNRYHYLMSWRFSFTSRRYPWNPPYFGSALFSYHAYPTPNGSGNFGGGIRNNSWDWFTPEIQNMINLGNVDGGMRTQITEFGWAPSELQRCGYTHDSLWRRIHGSNAQCNVTGEARDHTFTADITDFQNNWRHRAETLAVWITRGWPGEDNQYRADGLEQNGFMRPWFQTYRSSAPQP